MHFIMMIGLPASGKSTYAEKINMYGEDFKIISSDAIRKELFGDESVQKDNGRVFGELFKRVKSNLLKGNNVIVDATFINRKSRKGLLEMVSKIANVEKDAIVMTTPYHVCVARDMERDRTVGEDVIKKFLMRFQIPMYSEGFDDIQIIKHDYQFDDIISNVWNHSINNPHHEEDDLVSHCIGTKAYVRGHYNVGSCNLLEACLYHDVGFPMTETLDEDGISHYYGHENVGAYFWLNANVGNYEWSEYDIHRITALINYHMLPYSWDEEKIRETFKDDFLFADELMVLNEADRKAM